MDAADTEEGFADFRLRRKLEAAGQTPPLADAGLAASRNMLRAIGARRTAYPTDLTIAELDERGVLIEPRLFEFQRRDGTFDISSLVTGLGEGGNTLVLGEPGAGKTVLVYLVHRGLLERGRVALSISIVDLTTSAELTSDVLAAAVASRLPVGATVDLARNDLLYLVDGVDEAVASGVQVVDIARALEQLPQFGTVLATCRTREFEDYLVGSLNLDRFERIAVLDEWAIDTDFRDFVDRLVQAKLLEDDAVLEVVRASPALGELVRRPLFARMLTFVFPGEPSDITDVAGLYAAYLRHLARTVDDRLHRTGCETANTYSLWQDMAWYLFANATFHQELLPAAVPGAFLVSTGGLSPRCAQTVVHGLLDFGQYGLELRARFRHYSFFEFLVADHLASGLVNRAMHGERECSGSPCTRPAARDQTASNTHFEENSARACSRSTSGAVWPARRGYARHHYEAGRRKPECVHSWAHWSDAEAVTAATRSRAR